MNGLYEQFEKRFDFLLEGDYHRRFKGIPDTDVWGWCKSIELQIDHALRRGISRVSWLAFAIGIVIGWIACAVNS